MKTQTAQNKWPLAAGRPAVFGKGVRQKNPSVAQRKSKLKNGFTLVEMMLVVVIIGILAALVIPRIAGQGERARVTAAEADINGGIKSALGQYEVDNGFYPHGLQDLITQPGDAKNWHGPYLDNLPMDPWSNAYLYDCPGKHNPNGYDLWSAGPPNGKPIGNWTTTE